METAPFIPSELEAVPRKAPQSKFSIAPPPQYVSPDLESPNGPFDLYATEPERVSPCLSPKPAWDMDTLKRSICSARTGTGDVRHIIETCTFKPREQAFTTLINMCGQLRDWQKAVEVFDAMQSVRGVKSNMYTYSALIAACSSAGEWVKALEFFEQMKEAAKTDPNCAPNEVTYSSLITACERGGQFEKALAIYDEMVAQGVPGDHITYSSVLSACEKSRNWPRAEKLLTEMHSRGLTGNAVIYSELLLYYAEQGDWSKALSMCLTMQTAGQDPSEGAKKMKGSRQKGRQCDAMVTISSPPPSVLPSPRIHPPCMRTPSDSERQDSGVCPLPATSAPAMRPPWDMETLKRAICFAKTGTGEVSRALETCTFRPREQAFTALINMCGRLRDWQKAVEVFEAMKNVRGVMPNTYTYSALIAACSSSGEWEKALAVFEAMKVNAQVDQGCTPNEVTYSALITACQRGGMFERALDLYDEMLMSGVKPDHITYSSVLAACEKSERWDRVEEILDVMHSQGLCGPMTVYAELISHYADYGAYSKALQVIHPSNQPVLHLESTILISLFVCSGAFGCSDVGTPAR